MNGKSYTIPAGVLEIAKDNGSCFKVKRVVLREEPKKDTLVSFFMEGSGFSYVGMVYHKNEEYMYFRLVK